PQAMDGEEEEAEAELAARRALLVRGLLPQAAGGGEGDKTGLALAERGLLPQAMDGEEEEAEAELAARRALLVRGLLPQAAGGEEGGKTGLALAERGLLPQAMDGEEEEAEAELAARRALVVRGLLPQAAGGEEGDKTGLALAEQELLPQAAGGAGEADPAEPQVAGRGGVGPAGRQLSSTGSLLPEAAPNGIAPGERWRLVLGRAGGERGGRAGRLAAALDELYGSGRGEGSGPGLDGGGRGGREAPFPGVREWSEELAALFGPGVREEVLAAAVAHGRTDVLQAVDPEAVRPSVDLLRTVLQHAGGLPESRVAALRPLVKRLVDELAKELATRLRPALTGITLPRPSRRPGGRLDLDRTIRANLATARPGPDGGTLIVPERPVFRTRAAKANDWRLVLVVDVSGSMEASTVWAALTASILAGVPSLTTHFVAFSTEVVDLSGRVEDPLGLLLEVRVGGGTHIAAGLRYARGLVTVPSRTMVVVVSDFEEGYPLGGLLAETRSLVGEGCRLLGCAALDDTGRPRYSKAVAEQLVAAGMPVAALSPLELARWVGEKIA
ncbi:VWA domain-containing protein, partial [Kitasatospora sp. NPDC088134]|uniref:VWA domain-containing protein n=1 Tax=Kitasatospora sp. NPDC088134 TaxID=3364071 RepID=UPI0037F6C4EB